MIIIAHKFNTHLARIILFGLFNLIAYNASAEAVVVVSSHSNLLALSKQQVTSLFLGQATTFPDGRHANVFNQPIGSEIRNEFHIKLTGMNPAQLNAYWSMRVFSGNGRPPKELNDSIDVKKRLNENPNSIGYIEKSVLDDSLRVVYSP